jgi:hypothetical protein
MEWWNNGILGLKNGIYLIPISCLLTVSKKDFILLNPLFQLSSIPAFHVTGLLHRHFTLTRPGGPGFQR